MRFLNLNFSGMIQCGGTHPDFFFPNSGISAGFSTNLIESTFGIGTTTSSDNKFQHVANDGSSDWVDNVWRQNVAYNMGSAFFSQYSINFSVLRTRFYSNSILDCDRASANVSADGCGNIQRNGSTNTASILNNVFYQAWGDSKTTNVFVWDESGTVTVTKDYNLAFSPNGSVSFFSQWTGQAHEQSNVDPQLTNVSTQDFTLQSGSGARGAGGPLTTATSCSGTTLNVATGTGSFFIGDNSANLTQYSGKLVPGDTLTLVSTPHTVVSVSSDAITLDASVSCSNGDNVYYGPSSTIDIGAYPYKAGGYTITATRSGTTTVTIAPNDASLVRYVICYSDGVPYTVANASPYTCAASAGVFQARVYPRYPSLTPWVVVN
jgi:hypothetical protein